MFVSSFGGSLATEKQSAQEHKNKTGGFDSSSAMGWGK